MAPGLATKHLYDGREADCKLNILVVGCGLAGLAAAHCLAHAGHSITLIESASALGEVGAGIQVTPNVSRLLIRWGLGQELERVAVLPEAIVLRRYVDGERVGYTKWGDRMTRAHGAPYYHIHRADFHRLIYTLVESSPRVKIRLKSTVKSVNPDPLTASGPSVTLVSGEVIKGDLIIGADGVKSFIRQVVVGKPDNPEPTGDAAYRAIIPTDVMLKDPDLKPLVDEAEMTGWMGPDRHVMAYCIRAKKEYNLVMLHKDDGSVESWTAEGSAERMRADFDDFEPRVRKLLSHVKSTLKWRLMDRKPLHTWVHPAGRIVLIGDACHPMLPYRAQGAAMGIEDAAVLGNLLSRLSSFYSLPSFLHAYQNLRHARTSNTQASSRLNQRIFHLHDGPEQLARDDSMREAMKIELESLRREKEALAEAAGYGIEMAPPEGTESALSGFIATSGSGSKTNPPVIDANGLAGNANQWADQQKNIEQFSYDADAVANEWWEREGKWTIGKMKSSNL